jgi:hypothetical protein
MNTAQIFQILNLMLGMLDTAGINYQKFMAKRELAKAEGRELSESDFQELADDAQEAIDRL